MTVLCPDASHDTDPRASPNGTSADEAAINEVVGTPVRRTIAQRTLRPGLKLVAHGKAQRNGLGDEASALPRSIAARVGLHGPWES